MATAKDALQTLSKSAGSAALKRKAAQPTVKSAGEGAVLAPAPTTGVGLPELDEETYNAARQSSRRPAPAGAAGSLIETAKKYLGTPYVWGGTQPLGFDCSGFVQYVFKQHGINLPRISYQQAQAGQRVAIKDLRPGDLVAWDTSSRNNGADHISIYIGDGKVIHAPKPGDRVKISNLWNTERAWGVRMNF